MKTMKPLLAALACVFLFAAAPASAVVREVHNTTEFSALPSTLQTGDVVIVYAGDYTGINKKLTANAGAGNPVHIYASPLGSARFTGTTKIELAGTNMVFAGFRFEDGTVSSYALLYSRYYPTHHRQQLRFQTVCGRHVGLVSGIRQHDGILLVRAED